MPEKIEWYHAENSTLESNLSGNNWFAQSFTLGTVGRGDIDFLMKFVKLFLHTYGTCPGVVTVSLRAWGKTNGIPTGPDMVAISVTANTIPVYPTWVEFDCTTFPLLKAGSTYCLVARAPSCDGINNWVSWVCVSPGTYPGGNHAQSYNSGSVWTTIPQEDVGFEVWGDPTPYSQQADVESALGLATGSSLWGTGNYPTTAQLTDIIIRADDFINGACGHDWLLHNNVIEYYDGVGYGPRTGVILLRHRPATAITLVEYWNGTAWANDTAQGKSNQYPTKQCYEFYPEQGKIKFYRLQLDGPQVYRVTYIYGYGSPPDYIRDLSATLAAIDVLGFMSKGVHANFSVADLSITYPQGFEFGLAHRMLIDKAHRLLYKAAARRPVGESG
jgi:hypothetical protein